MRALRAVLEIEPVLGITRVGHGVAVGTEGVAQRRDVRERDRQLRHDIPVGIHHQVAIPVVGHVERVRRARAGLTDELLLPYRMRLWLDVERLDAGEVFCGEWRGARGLLASSRKCQRYYRDDAEGDHGGPLVDCWLPIFRCVTRWSLR